MLVAADRAELAVALALASKYAVHRTTVPVLATVKLAARGEHLVVSAADLDVALAATVAADVEEGGDIAPNAALLSAFVARAGGETLRLSGAGALLEARSGRAFAKIPTVPVEDFPEVFAAARPVCRFVLEADTLAGLLDATAHAVADKEDDRFYLRGTRWESHAGRLTLTATNGHRLSSGTVDAPEGAAGIPHVTVPPFARPPFKGMVTVEVGATFVRLSDTCHSFATRLIDGYYPDWRRIVPQVRATASVDRKAMVAALKCCLPVCDRGRGFIDLIHDAAGELVMRGFGDDGAEVEDVLDIDGELFAVSAAPRYILDALATFSGKEIRIGLGDVGAPIRFEDPADPSRFTLVMPMRGSMPHQIGPPRAGDAHDNASA